ncbi:MAG: hypothetical protein KBS81_07550, partial [Spirochaetales bacterium]|nr:hypothetical protein [Candidatus Physcosoma equi]
VEPYLHGGMGLAFLRYDELRNMVEGPENLVPSYSYHVVRPCFDFGAGIRTDKICLPFFQNPSFDVAMGVGTVVIPGVVTKTPTGIDLRRRTILPYFQMGVSIDMDL